jgi:tetratricopeptide (TPR) repeat protein
VQHFQDALVDDPSNTDARYALARARQRIPEYPAAATEYAAVYEATGDPRAAAGIGYCAHCQSQTGAASLWYQRAIAGGYRTAELYNNLAYCYQLLPIPEYQKAIDNYTLAISLKDDLRAAWWGRAEVAVLAAQSAGKPIPQTAVDDVKRAVAIRPPRAEVLLSAAYIHILVGGKDLGHRSIAVGHLVQSLELGLDPNQVRNSVYFKPLLGESRLQPFLTASTVSRNMVREPRILDPLHD